MNGIKFSIPTQLKSTLIIQAIFWYNETKSFGQSDPIIFRNPDKARSQAIMIGTVGTAAAFQYYGAKPSTIMVVRFSTSKYWQNSRCWCAKISEGNEFKNYFVAPVISDILEDASWISSGNI